MNLGLGVFGPAPQNPQLAQHQQQSGIGGAPNPFLHVPIQQAHMAPGASGGMGGQPASVIVAADAVVDAVVKVPKKRGRPKKNIDGGGAGGGGAGVPAAVASSSAAAGGLKKQPRKPRQKKADAGPDAAAAAAAPVVEGHQQSQQAAQPSVAGRRKNAKKPKSADALAVHQVDAAPLAPSDIDAQLIKKPKVAKGSRKSKRDSQPDAATAAGQKRRKRRVASITAYTLWVQDQKRIDADAMRAPISVPMQQDEEATNAAVMAAYAARKEAAAKEAKNKRWDKLWTEYKIKNPSGFDHYNELALVENTRRKIAQGADPDKPPRSQNEFFWFAKDKSPEVRMSMDHPVQKEVFRVLGVIWGKMSTEERAPYMKQAEADRQRHKEAMAVYNLKKGIVPPVSVASASAAAAPEANQPAPSSSPAS